MSEPSTGLSICFRESIVCTTPLRQTQEQVQCAERVAAWFGCKVVLRGTNALPKVFAETGAEVVIVADKPLKLYLRDDLSTPIFFHPGMAAQRLTSIHNGQADRLLTLLGVREGDTVVDATLGLGADSLVFAAAVGESGRILAIEASAVLGQLFRYAQRYETEAYRFVAPLMARIEVVVGSHTEVLASLPADSVDFVYFDPMFRRPIAHEHATIDAARTLTCTAALSEMAWREAKRVARRAVVLKERPHSGEFERLGVAPDKPRSKVAYGVWWKESM